METLQNVWTVELVFPEDVLYSPELLWVKEEAGDKLRLGLSDLGVRAVKWLAYIEMKVSVGAQVKKGDVLGIVETSKSLWEIISPISGIITNINPQALKGQPSFIMADPYGDGWLIDMEKVSETDSELKELHKGGEAATMEWIKETAEEIVPLMTY